MLPENKFIIPEIRSIIQSKDYSALKELFEEIQIPDIADIVTQLSNEECALLFRLLPKHLARQVFEYLSPLDQEKLLVSLSTETVAELIAEMSPDDRTALLEELPDQITNLLVAHLPADELAMVRKLLAYPEKSVGRLMTPDYMALLPELTTGQAIEQIRKEGIDKETINIIYLVNKENHLLGWVTLRDLVISPSEKKLGELRRGEPVSISAMADQEEVARLVSRYDLLAVPVVDDEQHLIGVITVDDIIDVIEEEATEDIYRLTGSGKVESVDIMEASVFNIVRKRLPWLIICLLGGLLSGSVIGVFEETIQAIVVLAIFIPVIMGMGGNVGTQSATIFVRGLATGEIKRKDIWIYLLREMKIGLSMGLINGLVIAFAAALWQGIPMLGVVVGISMFATIFMAATIGTLIPTIFNHFGIDPAITSGPFVTTVKDVIGLLIYFFTASLFMKFIS